MKVILTSVLLMGISAFAGPNVGDKTGLSIEYTAGGETHTGTATMEITAIANQTATVHFELMIEGQDRQIFDEEDNVAELGYIADEAELKTICEQKQGELGSAEVNGSSIMTCKITDGDNFETKAVVPFGMFEAVTNHDDVKSHLKLLEFTFGK